MRSGSGALHWLAGNATFVPTHGQHNVKIPIRTDGGFMTEKATALFRYTDLYGGYNGGQAECVRVFFADYGPRVVSDRLTD
ncbi:hypothetical protein [Adhaeribacter aquaticus]|uniref:hypothetical protein n=1 Tax=Adhaeribacter aquaticus TaxID=299567 RepID=UPI00040FAF90|nr:hypothetical protein [Adhaeribacter aquaticus]